MNQSQYILNKMPLKRNKHKLSCVDQLMRMLWAEVRGTQPCFSSRSVSQAVLMVKNLPVNAGNMRDVGSIPGFGRSLGGGHGHPLQYSCLENPMDSGAWKAHSMVLQRVRHD